MRSYTEAARLRDCLQEVQSRADAAANKTSQDRELLQRQKTFSLGQRVLHAVHGYRGVICGCSLLLQMLDSVLEKLIHLRHDDCQQAESSKCGFSRLLCYALSCEAIS